MKFQKPIAKEINIETKCNYGCDGQANFIFSNGKYCCSAHHNSCMGKRKQFSDRTDHLERAKKSLETRTKLGITKTSQIKATATRKQQGHYKKLANTMRKHWENNPWDNNKNCPILEYKNLGIPYQGTYEFDFLETLEKVYGSDWISKNVKRGPCVWYLDPEDNTKKLYISDYIIDNTIYEIKSNWTWNKKGKDPILENRNKAKLNQCLLEGFEVVLVLERKEIKYEK
jgi:hypothetical protein